MLHILKNKWQFHEIFLYLCAVWLWYSCVSGICIFFSRFYNIEEINAPEVMPVIVNYKYHVKSLNRKKMTTIKNQLITFPWFPLSASLPVFPVEVWWWLEERTHTLPGSLPFSWCGCTHRYTSPSSSPSPRSADLGQLDLPCWRTGRRSLLLQSGRIMSDNRNRVSILCI